MGTSHERLSTFFIADADNVAQQYKRSLAVTFPWQHFRHLILTATYRAQQHNSEFKVTCPRLQCLRERARNVSLCRYFLSRSFLTKGYRRGHTSRAGSTPAVYYTRSTSKMKYCAIMLSQLGRNILCKIQIQQTSLRNKYVHLEKA
jgi:hypothetical protein